MLRTIAHEHRLEPRCRLLKGRTAKAGVFAPRHGAPQPGRARRPQGLRGDGPMATHRASTTMHDDLALSARASQVVCRPISTEDPVIRP